MKASRHRSQGIAVAVEKYLDLKEPRVNWSQATKVVLDQYDGILDAVQKEAVQNAHDAMSGPVTNWRTEIRYLPDEQKLEIEDFGTTGIVQWEYYKSLWFSEKAFQKGKGGSRGQGKFVLVAAGQYMITETVVKGKYRILYTDRNARYDDNENNVLKVVKRKLHHPGTLITVYGLRPDFQNDFADYNGMIRYIQLAWWKIIQDENAKISYRVGDRIYQIPPLRKPPFTVQKKFADISVQYVAKDSDGKPVEKKGTVTDINLYYNKGSDVPAEFRGKIAITVNGQTIEWWEPSIPPPHNNRFFGTLEAEYLREAEQPNHSKFMRDHDAWKVTRKHLDDLVQQFLKPMYEKETSVDKQSLREAIMAEELLNRAFLEGFADIDPLGDVPKQSRNREKYTDVYIRYLLLDHREYRLGDTVLAKTVVANSQQDKRENYSVQFTVIDPNGSKICDTEHTGLTFKGKVEKEFEFKCELANDSAKGIYVAALHVKNAKGAVVHQNTKRFDVEPDQPIQDEKKLKDLGQEKKKDSKKVPIRVNLKLGVFDDGRLVRYFPPPTNVIYVNYKHGTIEYIRRNAAKALVYHLVVAAGEELIRLKYRGLIDTTEESGEELSSEKIKQTLDEIITRSHELGRWTGMKLLAISR